MTLYADENDPRVRGKLMLLKKGMVGNGREEYYEKARRDTFWQVQGKLGKADDTWIESWDEQELGKRRNKISKLARKKLKSLYLDDMIIYEENPVESIKKQKVQMNLFTNQK